MLLSPSERNAVYRVVERVLNEVAATLVEAALFGSHARGDAGPESDVDVLLVFRSLPPEREPFAGQAEGIAGDVAGVTGVPVTVWSVSLFDLEEGNRTPMLVDALADAIPVWCTGVPIEYVPFTAADAIRCVGALFDRVEEGSEEFTLAAANGDIARASRRARDDVVRMCTARLLARGVTRPRRAAAVRAFVALEFGDVVPPSPLASILDWAAGSFGASGKDDDGPVPPPPGGPRLVGAVVDHLRERAGNAVERLLLEHGSIAGTGDLRTVHR